MKISLKNTVLTASLALSFSASFSSHATDEVSAQAVTRQVSRSIQDVVSGAQFDDSTGQHGFFMLPDACTNIPGYQGSAPSGYEVVGTTCTAPCVAPASTFVDEVRACDAGFTGSRTVRTITSYSCPSTYSSPVPSSSSGIVADNCVSTNRWPWEGKHRDVVALSIFCTTRLDIGCGSFNSTATNNGRLPSIPTGYEDISIYMGFGYANIPTNFVTASNGSYWSGGPNVRARITDLRDFLRARGFSVMSIYIPRGNEEYANVYSFTASMGSNLFVGWATTINHGTYGWDWTESKQARSSGTAERYMIPMPLPYSGYSGAVQPNGQMQPNYLGAFTTSEFDESSAWRRVSRSYHVNISPALPSNMYYCGDIWKRGFDLRNTGSAIVEINYLMKTWCSIGLSGFTTWRDTARTTSGVYKDFSGVVPYLPWSFPQETMMEPPANRPYN